MSSSRGLLPDHLKQEIQALIAVNCRELVYQGKDCKDEAQMDKMKKTFHGTETHASLLTQFLEGKSPFDCCHEVCDLENNKEGNEERVNSKVLELKPLLHCVPNVQHFVYEKAFTRENLTKSRGILVTGRSLNDECNVAGRNYKMALKHANEFTNGKQGLELPSGTTHEDMILFVRQKMFVCPQGAKDPSGFNRAQKKLIADHEAAVDKARAEGSNVPPKPTPFTEDDVPEEHLFTGHFAFVLYGPLGTSKVSLSCFTVDGEGVNKVGRKEMRKQEQKTKDVEREKKHHPDDYNRRGVSIANAAAATHLAQKEESERRRNVCDQLFIETTNHKNLLTELSTVDNVLKDARERVPPEQTEVDHLEQWQGGLFDKLNESRKRKMELEAESDRLRKQPTSQAVKSHMKVASVEPKAGGEPKSDAPVNKRLFETPTAITASATAGGDDDDISTIDNDAPATSGQTVFEASALDVCDGVCRSAQQVAS